MAYTKEQLEDAEDRLATAKENWQESVTEWAAFVNLLCYKDTKYDAVAGATWFTPNDSSCTQAGSCKHSDKKNCQDVIADIRANVIPSLRVNYAELGAAQTNYNTVLAGQAVTPPPTPPANGNGNGNGGNAEKKGKSNAWVYFIIIAVIVVGVLGLLRYKKVI